MKEAKRAFNSLINSKDLEIQSVVTVSDFDLFAGESLWIQVDHEDYADVFISMLLGILKISKGFFWISDIDISKKSASFVSDITTYTGSLFLPDTGNLETLVHIYSQTYNLKHSTAYSEFKNNLNGLGGGYALDLDIKDMTQGTKRIVITSLALSFPLLIVIFTEPYLGLDKEAVSFLSSRLEDLCTDGSCPLIFSSERPPVFNKYAKMERV